jgi:hypothetical protein
MRRIEKLLFRAASLAAAYCVSALFAPAQTVASAPVSVAAKAEEVLNGNRYFILTLRNEGSKPIVGVLLRCALLDAQGKEFDHVVLGGVTLDANVDRHDPGTTWKIQVEAVAPNHPGDRVSDVRPDIDYVLYRDLFSAGPDAEKRGLGLRAEYEGSQMQLARLRRLMQTKGIGAVQEILAREEPRFSRFSKP